MNRIKQLSKILLLLIFLTSCKTSIDKDETKSKSEEKIIDSINSEKKRMEIKFSSEFNMGSSLFVCILQEVKKIKNKNS